MEIRNPVFNAFGGIDCEIEHPQFGWIPFTAYQDDPEERGRDVYAAALAMNPAPYVAPPAPVPQVVSRFQAKAALALAGKLTEADAIVAQSGDAVLQLAWAEANEFRRNSPGINTLAPLIGLDSDDLDDLFRTAAGIVA